MDIFTLHRGDAPLLVSLPHDGSFIPEALATRMTEGARHSPDTDWHVGRLYDFARDLGASVLRPAHSRYVVDLNRPSDGHALYPGRSETGLVPTIMFDGTPIYRDGLAPDAGEIAERVDVYWRPYHQALKQELERLRSRHQRVVLWEGHSIRGVVPMLFDGRLPDMNLGTSAGASCHPRLRQSLEAALAARDTYTQVVDGRFRGGFITRHYGQPDTGVDAVQMELVQATYMDEATFVYQEGKAVGVQAVLRSLLEACLAHAGAGF